MTCRYDESGPHPVHLGERLAPGLFRDHRPDGYHLCAHDDPEGYGTPAWTQLVTSEHGPLASEPVAPAEEPEAPRKRSRR